MQKIPFLAKNFPELSSKLWQEEVFIFPSDTSYGFSGIAAKKMVQAIQKLKQRPESKPFLLLVADFGAAAEIVSFSPQLERFAQERWRAEIPTTILAPRRTSLPDFFSDAPELAVRIPAAPLLRKFLQTLGGQPLISTSANISGAAPLFSAAEIQKQFGHASVFFADAGDLPHAPPSEIWTERAGNLERIR